MYKTVWLFRRNPAMTLEEFVAHYERSHSKFIAHLQGVRKYFRRYLTKPDNPRTGEALEFDVMMESWFDDKASFEAAFARMTSLPVWADIVKDEERQEETEFVHRLDTLRNLVL
jgi:uncharacterized protein (TIGR02118 family)